MRYRSAVALCALTSLAALGACSDSNDDVTGVGNVATVRFINATGNSIISLAQNGTVSTGNSALVFGGSSTCLAVDVTNPNLTFTTSAGTTISTFVPNLAAGGNFTVIAYTDANGNTQFATLDNSFAPASGLAGVRVFNASSGSGNVVLVSDGVVLNNGTTVAFANGGNFFSVPAGTHTLLFNTGTGTATLATVGSVNLVAGTNTVVVIGPAVAGSTARRAFVSTGC